MYKPSNSKFVLCINQVYLLIQSNRSNSLLLGSYQVWRYWHKPCILNTLFIPGKNAELIYSHVWTKYFFYLRGSYIVNKKLSNIWNTLQCTYFENIKAKLNFGFNFTFIFKSREKTKMTMSRGKRMLLMVLEQKKHKSWGNYSIEGSKRAKCEREVLTSEVVFRNILESDTDKTDPYQPIFEEDNWDYAEPIFYCTYQL